MYKIGEFSLLAKTTIKTLRYYERENILSPSFIDNNGYRYYDSNKLLDLSKIISLRQLGLSIKEIKKYLLGESIDNLLNKRKAIIENEIVEKNYQLTKIKYLLEEKNMKYEVITKELPECIVYYKEGVLKDFSEATNFILKSGGECLELNPGLKCIEPDYCFMNYLDKEYKENNIRVRYVQAVEKIGNENENIKFKKLDSINALCIYHKGSYENLRSAYAFILNYIEENNYEIADYPRERYIDGMWNKESIDEWLTEIQIPIKNK